MKFEIGDSIVVRLTNEDGKVLDIIDGEHYLVEVRGVKFPVQEKQLDFPYFKMFSKKPVEETAKTEPKKKYIDQVRTEKQSPKYQVAQGVWLLCFPVFYADEFGDDVVDRLKIYLVNQTKETLHFKTWFKLKQVVQLEVLNNVAALDDFYLFDLDFEDINESPVIDFEFSLAKADPRRVDYFEASWKPKGKQVYKQIETLKHKGESFFSSQLFAEYPIKQKVESLLPDASGTGSLDKLRSAGFKVLRNKKIPGDQPPQTVLDLHIEKLTNSYSHLTATEKLDLQLSAFEKWIDQLQQHYIKQAWVIHGVGSGKLRDEVHTLLRQRNGIKTFVHQFHPWYGNGATEIYFE